MTRRDILDPVRTPAAPGVAVFAAVLLVAACGTGSGGEDVPTASPSVRAAAATVDPTRPAEAEPAAAETPEPSPAPSGLGATSGPPSADEVAGLRSRTVVERGNGATVVVPGTQRAPGDGDERRVRVEVEGGLDVDGRAFARFVLDTLNDPRSWSHDGLTFSRTDGDADVVVVLASPQTSAAMCQPLRTFGKLSCREGPRAILTMYRWVNGMEDYGDDLTGYRRYLVNHEVGHVLGHGHESCPAPGERAPVMQQQTKDVDPCVPNSWPYP